MESPVIIAEWNELDDRQPVGVVVDGVDLVVVRYGGEHSVLYGRCLHRGVRMSEAVVEGDDIVCQLHKWDYRLDSGVSSYDNTQCLTRFASEVRDGSVWVDRAEVVEYRRSRALAVSPERPSAHDEFSHFQNEHTDTPAEPFVGEIHHLAEAGIEGVGHHGPLAAMGVARDQLPRWDDIQILTAQLGRPPLLDDADVATGVTIGPRAERPLVLDIPLFVSDMSFGALSSEAKTALAEGAEGAGTGICSGEGGMLPAEQAANSRYFYELASGKFGWDPAHLSSVQAIHLKFGQGAKTGTGGHLPADKVTSEIADVRGLPEGQAAVSPARFPEFESLSDVTDFVTGLRGPAGGIPIGAKMSAQHIEDDIDAALEAGFDYIILDGRGGGTGAAPLLFRDNISVPTMPAIARARRHLDRVGATDITLVATGGLRTPSDMVKAMALGADALAVANVAIQAIGCVGMRACHTGRCPVGIATQDEELRARLPVAESGDRLTRYLSGVTHLMSVLARAMGHDDLGSLSSTDLTSFDRDTAALAGIRFAGVE